MANPTGKNQYSGAMGPHIPQGYVKKFAEKPHPLGGYTMEVVGYRKDRSKTVAAVKATLKKGEVAVLKGEYKNGKFVPNGKAFKAKGPSKYG